MKLLETSYTSYLVAYASTLKALEKILFAQALKVQMRRVKNVRPNSPLLRMKGSPSTTTGLNTAFRTQRFEEIFHVNIPCDGSEHAVNPLQGPNFFLTGGQLPCFFVIIV